MLSRATRRSWLVCLLLVTGVLVSGCGEDCETLTLEAEQARVPSSTAPLSLTAAVSLEGKPVQGVRLDFWVRDATVDSRAGYATSGADGTARAPAAQGVAGLSVRPVTSFYVEYAPLSLKQGYCRGKSAPAPLTVG